MRRELLNMNNWWALWLLLTLTTTPIWKFQVERCVMSCDVMWWDVTRKLGALWWLTREVSSHFTRNLCKLCRMWRWCLLRRKGSRGRCLQCSCRELEQWMMNEIPSKSSPISPCLLSWILFVSRQVLPDSPGLWRNTSEPTRSNLIRAQVLSSI